MKPSISLKKRTPTSIWLESNESGIDGAAVAGFQRWLHGQRLAVIVTSTLVEGVPTLPLSSVARLMIVALPGAPGDQS